MEEEMKLTEKFGNKLSCQLALIIQAPRCGATVCTYSIGCRVECSISIISLIGCPRFTETPTQNGVGNNETTPLLLDFLLGGFTELGENRINESTG